MFWLRRSRRCPIYRANLCENPSISPACSANGSKTDKRADSSGLHRFWIFCAMSLAETRLPSNLAGEAAGRMWMPFGNPPHPDDALRDTSFDAVLLFPELGEWKAIFDRLAVSGLTRTHIATRARVNGVPLLQGIACVRRGLHPVLVADAVLLSVNLALERVDGTGQSLLLVLDVASICLGYLSFLLLGWTTLSEKGGEASACRAFHAGLLADDVCCRMARAPAAFPGSASLGKDVSPRSRLGQRRRTGP